MNKVLIVQRPNRDLDLSSAVQYGAIHYAIEDNRFQASKQPGRAQRLIEEAAIAFDPENDYLVFVGGDGAGAILMGMAINRHHPGKAIKILRWERTPQQGQKPVDPRIGFYTPSTLRM